MIKSHNALGILISINLLFKLNRRVLLTYYPYIKLVGVVQLFYKLQLVSLASVIELSDSFLLICRLKYLKLKPIYSFFQVYSSLNQKRLVRPDKLRFLAQHWASTVLLIYTSKGVLPHYEAIQQNITGYVVGVVTY